MISTNDIIRLDARVGDLLHGARLTGLEIPRDDYDALLDAHRKELRGYTFELPKPPEYFLVLQVAGVTITRPQIPVSAAMCTAAQAVMGTGFSLEKAKLLYRAMQDAREAEERGRV